MKIVHIEDYFHPDAGYQINILPKYMVKAGHDVTIITSQMDKIPEKLTKFFGSDNIAERDKEYCNQYGVKIIRIPVNGFVANRVVLSRELYKTIKLEKPDVVYVHGNDSWTGIRMLLRYHRNEYPIMLDSHMLAMASTSRFSRVFRFMYKSFITPIIKRNELFVIRTQDDPYVEKYLGIPHELSPWISVGSDTMLFKPDLELRHVIRNELNIAKDDFVVLYAGKLDAAKGGMLLAETIQKRISSEQGIVFLIIGNTVGEYGRQVEDTFNKCENRIIRLPSQKYSDLQKYYAASDLAVFPKQCSLSFYDVQASGLPVVSEDNNINCERCSHGNGMNFRSGDSNDFREKILCFLSLNQQAMEKYRRNSREYIVDGFDYFDISNDYINYLDKTVCLFRDKNRKTT